MKLKTVSKISLEVEREDVLISQIRKMFYITLKHSPSADTRPEGASDILTSVVFNSALVKLYMDTAPFFTYKEKKSVECILKRVDVVEQNNIQRTKIFYSLHCANMMPILFSTVKIWTLDIYWPLEISVKYFSRSKTCVDQFAEELG